MAITFNVQPGYQFSASERVTYSKLNLLGTPGITLAGTVDSSEITDGAITTQKLASGIDINSKISDHNLALTKLAQGTQGQILYYDSNGDLVTLAPGTSGYFLKTNGDGSDPEWSSQSGVSSINISQITTDGADKILTTDSSGNIQWETDIGLLPTIAPSGSMAYFNGSEWVAFDLGASGTTLQSNGTAPVWQSLASTAYAAKGRFTGTGGPGTESITITGDTNIASATYTRQDGSPKFRRLTINFTDSVSVDLPIFIRLEHSALHGESLCEVTARTTSQIIMEDEILATEADYTDPVWNVIIPAS